MSNLPFSGQKRPEPVVTCSLRVTDPFGSLPLDNNGPLAVPFSPVPLYVQLMKVPQWTFTDPSPVTEPVSCPSFNSLSTELVVVSFTSHPLLQLEYVKFPLISSGLPKRPPVITSPPNNTSHSTFKTLDKRVALPTDVSCMFLINWPSGHTSCSPVPGSTLHSDVVSAIAELAPTKAIAISAASAARPSILIGFT